MQTGTVRSLTVSDADVTTALACRIGECPLFEGWVRAVEEYRRKHNTVADFSAPSVLEL